MEKAFLISIISGLFAFFSATIALMQSLKVAKIKAKTELSIEKIKKENNIALENIKNEHNRRIEAFKIAKEESAPIENALSKAWEDIQKIKNTIYKLLAPAPYDIDIAVDTIKMATKSIEEEYEKWGNRLPEVAKNAWYSSKFLSFDLLSELNKCSTHKNTSLQLSNDITNKFNEIRFGLSEHQSVLSTIREELRELNIKKVLELI